MAPADTRTQDVRPELAATETFQARMTPQAWVRDDAITVDAPGPDAWDCTAAVNENRDYFNRLLSSGCAGDWNENGSGLLDNNDVLKGDPQAPEWVRQWDGPFDIHVTRTTGTV